MDWFRFETRSSNPYTYGDRTFTVHSWVLQILAPWGGGLIWNYPTAVTVRSTNADADSSIETRIPIVDPTRLAQLTLLAFSLLGAILFWRKKS